MTTDNPIDVETRVNFNGVNARTGAYLFEAMSASDLADVAMGKVVAKDHLAELKFRNSQKDETHYGVKAGIDPTRLDETGWGVIFPAVTKDSEAAREQEAIVEALAPLLALRRAQATRQKAHYYKEYRYEHGYRPGESKQKFLARLGTGPGPADPDKVPYYLLIVGSPQLIPFHVQYQIDVQYAVGRIHFETLEEYDNYARSVVAAETGGLVLPRELALVGVANPDDPATILGRKHLVEPLAQLAERWTDVGAWTVSRHVDEQATKAGVARLFGGPSTPALIFTSSHGMGFDKGDPLQRRHQGALLMQDWPGPRRWKQAIDERLYFSADDLRSDAGLLGTIAFNFACYGGGTPEFDEFSKQAFKQRKAIADEAFVAGLPRKLLAHPKGGALATIAHVERAWGYSFMWATGKRGAAEPQLAVFESTLKSLMQGLPVGLALEYFNERYAEMASDLAAQIEELEFDPDAADPYTLASMWTSSNDARGYAITGDPAVRLRFEPEPDQAARSREAIELASFGGPASAAGQTGAADQAASADGPPAAEAPAAAASVEFGLFGRSKADADDGEQQGGVFEGFVARIVGTLGRALEDAMTLEVRTYVSSNPGAAAAVDRGTLARDGDLRAFTRMEIDGDVDVIVPERDGVIDTELWSLHVEMVKQAQAARAEMINTVVSTISGLVKR